jgi:hypothetical protein
MESVKVFLSGDTPPKGGSNSEEHMTVGIAGQDMALKDLLWDITNTCMSQVVSLTAIAIIYFSYIDLPHVHLICFLILMFIIVPP